MAWLGTWANRFKVSIDHTKVDAALSNFPLTLILSSSSGIGDVDVSAIFDELTSDANRKKIAVTTSDGTTQCPVEIELWDDANEKAVLHIKVPSVASGAATDLYLYYDSAQADNTTYVGDTGDTPAQSVWDSNFVAVYHMAQDPNGDVADAIKDSTYNANDGTPSGSMTTADLVDGKVGKGIDFDGSDDEINIPSFTFESGGTIEMLVKFDASNVHLLSGASTSNRIFRSATEVQFQTTGGTVKATVGELDASYHLITLSLSSSTDLDWYYDGAYIETDTVSATVALTSIGGKDFSTAVLFFVGIIDEVRLSSTTVRSAAWIKATYNSLWDSLVTFTPDVNVSATSPSFTLTPYTATVSAPTVVNASAASFTLTPYNPTVQFGTFVNASCATMEIATYAASIIADTNVLANCAALVLTSHAAVISYDIEILPSTSSFTLTSYNAAIWDGAAWEKWISENGTKISRLYYFVLTGDADGETDITIPISSWQARRKSGSPTFLSVVIPGSTYQDAIAARPNGEMQVYMAYLVDGTERYREIICRADYETIRIDQGGKSQSITLQGHKTETFTTKTIDLQGVVYVSNDDGLYRYRCAAPDMFLNPGDTARYDGNSITVNQIVNIVGIEGGSLTQSMDVNESEI